MSSTNILYLLHLLLTYSLIHLPTEIQHPFTTPTESTEPNFIEKEHLRK